jgi:hypothetical protein
MNKRFAFSFIKEEEEGIMLILYIKSGKRFLHFYSI